MFKRYRKNRVYTELVERLFRDITGCLANGETMVVREVKERKNLGAIFAQTGMAQGFRQDLQDRLGTDHHVTVINRIPHLAVTVTANTPR